MLREFNVTTSGLIPNNTPDVTKRAGVSVTHRLRSSLSDTDKTDNTAGLVDNTGGTDTDRMLKNTDDSFAGIVHGVSGQFRCDGADGCMITVTGTYHDNVDGGSPTATENRLKTVMMSVDAGMLYFRPNSATASVSLCDDNVQCSAGTDTEYMVFGWWREDPSSAAGGYDFGVFAEVIAPQGASTAVPSGLNATYDGTAVGMYVEQDPSNAVDTHRQGEFTADVGLSVEDGSVSGTIDDFRTTPTGGSAAPVTADRWLVELEEMGGKATIKNLAGEASGSWVHAFVPPHANSRCQHRPAGGRWRFQRSAFGFRPPRRLVRRRQAIDQGGRASAVTHP